MKSITKITFPFSDVLYRIIQSVFRAGILLPISRPINDSRLRIICVILFAMIKIFRFSNLLFNFSYNKIVIRFS